jgi:hypothetical protein
VERLRALERRDTLVREEAGLNTQIRQISRSGLSPALRSRIIADLERSRADVIKARLKNSMRTF